MTLDIRDLVRKRSTNPNGIMRAPSRIKPDVAKIITREITTGGSDLLQVDMGEATDLFAPVQREMSMAEKFASEGRLAELVESLTPSEANTLLHAWDFWARPSQLPPEEFRSGAKFGHLILAGRGFGKTRTGAEQTKEWVEDHYDRNPEHTEHLRIALIAETAADARDVMIRGESGILAISRADFYPKYQPSKRLLTWPCGCMAMTFSGEEPDQLRGPQFHKAWVEELAKYKYPVETIDNLEFALRLGRTPQMVVTTTPRPIPVIKKMIADPSFIVTRGSSFENLANLPPSFIKRVIDKYRGTRIGRQELLAEILDDIEGALWTRSMIDRNRVTQAEIPEIKRIVVAIDPSVTSGDDSDECGITCGGLGVNNHGYLFRDLSGVFSADTWARRAVETFDAFGADKVVAEINNGGDLVEKVIRTVRKNIPYGHVHASRGKSVRAAPVSALMEQGKVHHVGNFAMLEDQLVNYMPDGYIGAGSPDRGDSYVWLFTELMLDKEGSYDPKAWTVLSG